MNCDQTFEVLTRGPFPSGTDHTDLPVEAHLAACHDCRQLAEALRPALGLFHEAMAETDALTLPGYRGELAPVAEARLQTLVANSSPSPLRRLHRSRRSSRFSALLMGTFTATCLLGFLLGVFGNQLFQRPTTTAAGTASQRADTGRTPDREGKELLAALGLPSACRDSASSATGTSYRCCTHCHAAKRSAAAPVVSFASLTTSCIACHSQAQPAAVSWTDHPSRSGRVAT